MIVGEKSGKIEETRHKFRSALSRVLQNDLVLYMAALNM